MTSDSRNLLHRMGDAVHAFKSGQKKLPAEETAISETSAIYNLNDFEKYNPDDLIGRKGYGIYKRMMQDEQVKAVVKFKRDAITSRDYFFQLDYEKHGISKEEAQRRITMFEFLVDKMQGSWMDALNNIMSAFYGGFSMTEKVFTQVEWDGLTWWGLKAMKLRPFDTFVFEVDEYGNITKLTQKVGGKRTELDARKFVHMVINPDIDEHYGQSDIREAYRAWFSKDVIIKFRNMWLERHAGGFRWLTANEQGSIPAPGTKDYVNLQAVMSNINTATGIILPKGLELHSDYPANNVAFKEAIEDNDTAIARAILVPPLLGVSPQGDTGSYSQSQTQLDAFLWTLEADTKRLEEVLNEQLFRQLGEVNFGDDAWPRFKFKPPSTGKILEIVKVWKDLITAGAAKRTDADEAHIRDLLGIPAATEEEAGINVEPTGEPEPTNNKPLDQDDGATDDDATQMPDEAEMTGDSTIIGKGLVSVSAFTKATKRVDFAVIEQRSEQTVEAHTAIAGDIMGSIFDDLVTKAKEGGELDEDVSENVAKLKPNSKLKAKLNKTLSKTMRDGWKQGEQQAATEIDKAKGSHFSANVGRDRLDMIAEDYFQTQAFTITGNLTDEATKLIEREILNGAKYGKPWAEVERAIYQAAATKGLISTAQARDALGEALQVENPDARLRTTIRTSTFDAINNARYSYFTDPELGGFVQAFEYSAILDTRTTQVCRHLDEEDAGNHSAEWYEAHPEYRPPNHFNCRSLLVPVTEVDMDSYVEGPEPSIQPQEGFR